MARPERGRAPSRGAEAPAAVGAPPSHSAAASETKAAGRAYRILLRTTPAMSAPWVPADAMVVSEMGDTLSPKVAPPRIAPRRNAGSALREGPAGYSRGMQMSSVPRLVPVAVLKTAATRKAAAT
jgi:hypothetical protein